MEEWNQSIQLKLFLEVCTKINSLKNGGIRRNKFHGLALLVPEWSAMRKLGIPLAKGMDLRVLGTKINQKVEENYKDGLKDEMHGHGTKMERVDELYPLAR